MLSPPPPRLSLGSWTDGLPIHAGRKGKEGKKERKKKHSLGRTKIREGRIAPPPHGMHQIPARLGATIQPARRPCTIDVNRWFPRPFALLAQTVRLPTADCQTARLPNCQTAKLPNCQTAKLPNCQTAKLPNCQTAKLPPCLLFSSP
jgi:hypothetical protein